MPINLSNPFVFRPRGYLHFDHPISHEVAEQLVTSTEAVAGHPFYPFISHINITQKIRKRPGGGVERKAPKHRPIAYAAHKDSHIFSHYLAHLERLYEDRLANAGLGEVITAFRSLHHRCNIHFANEAFEFIHGQTSCFVIASDISDFFNQLDHRQLKRAWIRLLDEQHLPEDHYAVFKAITRYCTVDRAELYGVLGINARRPRADGRQRICTTREFRERVRGSGLCVPNNTGRGIPQGSPISAVLANLYMLELDTAVNAFAVQHGGLYRRYCDDLLVVLPTAESRAEAHALILRLLGDLGLEAHPEKTELIEFAREGDQLRASKPLNYLGFVYDGVHKRVRPASIARFYKKMRLGVGRAKAVRYRVDRRNGRGWTRLRRRKLHLQYSYLGRHNFTSYVFKAARIMNSPGMKKQVKRHWKKLQELIGEGT